MESGHTFYRRGDPRLKRAAHTLTVLLGFGPGLAVLVACTAADSDQLARPRTSIAAAPETVTATADPPTADGEHGVGQQRAERLPPERLLVEPNLALTDEQQRAWSEGQNAVTERCAKEHGYTFRYPEFDPAPRRDRWQRTVDFLYFDRKDLIVAHGYAWPSKDAPPAAPGTSYDQVLLDVVEQCYEQVRRQYAELSSRYLEQYEFDDDDLQSWAASVDAEIAARVESAPELEAARQSLDSCLIERGFVGNWEGFTLAALTIERAQAEYECRMETGFSEQLVTWMEAAVADWLDINAEAVAIVRQFNHELGELGTRLVAEAQSED